MAVVEYKMHRINGSDRRHVPDWVGSRGHWPSGVDNTFIGWVDDNADYYIPDTVVTLTKDEFVTRQTTIHATIPWQHGGPDGTSVDMTEAEVIEQAGEWYDNFVAEQSS